MRANTRSDKHRSLGAPLELRRVAFRLARLELVLDALEDRARAYGAADRPVPTPLQQAIGGFQEERTKLQARRRAVRPRPLHPEPHAAT